jgi:hypothetical protein
MDAPIGAPPLFVFGKLAKGFLHNSDADCIAITVSHVVIAGLDPANHAAKPLA